jgi:hypothetical protein
MFGGNSNWRGPIWMPVNMLILRGLLQFYLYYGDTFKIECPTGSGRMMNLFDVTMEDPHWRDHVLFFEYFHGDNGAGLGASHQTGWTGLAAKLIQMLHILDAEKVLKGGSRPVMQIYRRSELAKRSTAGS